MLNIKYISVFIALLLPVLLSAQIRPDLDISGEEEEENTEGPEKKVIPRIVSWQLGAEGFYVDSVKMDTTHRYFHNYNPIFKNSITNTFTGNYGGAYLSNDFSQRRYSSDFYFARTHDAYLLTPERILFYNTTTPYTYLDYSQSENKNRQNETRFNVLHSQNITRDLNVTFRYDQDKSDGQYNYQENSHNSISLYSSYNTDKLNLYGGFITNRIRNMENGGMADDGQLLEIADQEIIVVKLTDARSIIKNSYFFVNGEYRLGTMKGEDEKEEFKPIASIHYLIRSENYLRQFWEGETSDNSAFFPVHYINREFTHDSVRMNVLKNMVQLIFHESAQKKFSFGQRAFLGTDIFRRIYSAPGYDEPVFPFHPGTFESHLYKGPAARWNKRTYTNLYIGGGIFRRLGSFWNWEAEGKQYITGFLAGQTELTGVVTKPVAFGNDSLAFIKISGELINRVPDYFQQEYFSNRFSWDNDFINEQMVNASFGFHSPLRKLEAGVRYSLFNNFIYHNLEGIPAQTRSEQQILSAYLNKVFTLGNFSLKTQMLWQKASAEQYIRLPMFSARAVPSYEMLLAQVLYAQLGVDIRYNTKYYADAYNPATGFFHLQNEKALGSYPYMDAFINLKLKRTSIFFQYMNLGSAFLNQPYFTALHYPMNKMTYRLGVAWSFYN